MLYHAGWLTVSLTAIFIFNISNYLSILVEGVGNYSGVITMHEETCGIKYYGNTSNLTEDPSQH